MIVGIEVGGTFTDLIAVRSSGATVIQKTPSTPHDPSAAAITGLRELLTRVGARGEEIAELLHGSTIAANALIQRRGARVAMLTTEGFRDVLFIQRQDKPVVYDMFYQKPEPLIRRDQVKEISERMAADGSVVIPLDENSVIETVNQLVEEHAIESFAVCLLHAYSNPSHERAIARLIREQHPNVFISLSSDISPEHREYERASTTVISAFVRPVVDRYLSTFQAEVSRTGFTGAPLIMLSNGGVAPVEAARRLAVNMFLSGPAAAVTGAAEIARHAHIPNIISIDVGGTSSDVCLITGGIPQTKVKGSSEFQVDGLPLNIVMTDIVSIGAGGGSITWIDEGGMLQVGPLSAGAEPGPACYGKGGGDFCLTDAFLILGLLDPAIKLPGGICLDPNLSRAAAGPLCIELGLSETELADRVYRIAVANMAQALRRVSVTRGFDPRNYCLFACGGAGPLVATALADEARIPRVLVPPNPGVFSAVGLIGSNLRMDFVHAEGAITVNDMAAMDLGDLFDTLRQRARATFEALDLDPKILNFELACDARYRGQGYELRVRLDDTQVERDGPTHLAERFHEEHARQYGHGFAERSIELISLRLAAIRPRKPKIEGVYITPTDIDVEDREVHLDGSSIVYPVMDRSNLETDFSSEGPLIVMEKSTSTLVPSGWSVHRDSGGVLHLRRRDLGEAFRQ